MEYEYGDSSRSCPMNFTERLDWLMADFQKAKEAGDGERINSLRQQIWVAKDLAAGARPAMPAEDFQEIMTEMRQKQPVTEQPSLFDDHTVIEAPTETEVTSDTVKVTTNNPEICDQVKLLEKKLRKLWKKRSQIKELKKRQKAGDSLEINQVQKINREKAVEDEIDEVEEQLFRLQRV